MIGAIISFVMEIVRAIFEAITAFIRWCRENPKKAALLFGAIALVVATAYLTHRWTVKRLEGTIVELRAEVQKANEETQKRDAKIKTIEENSQKASEAAETEIKETKAKLAQVSKDFEAKIAAERKKLRVVNVKDPETGKDVPVVIRNGEVLCSKMFDAVPDTINLLIEEANRKAKGKTK